MIKSKLLVFTAFLGSSLTALADVKVNTTLCNNSQSPVEFSLYNHNDPFAGAIPLVKKAVRACSCVKKVTHTDLWHNQPPANIIQLVYRDVGSVKGTEIKACVDVKGKFKGYVEAGVNACAKATSKTEFLPAPELTYAQGDLKVLESRMMPSKVECNSKDLLGNCTKFTTRYDYTDGKKCSGNDG